MQECWLNTDLRRHGLGVCVCLGTGDPRPHFLHAGTKLDLVHVYSPDGMVSWFLLRSQLPQYLLGRATV